MKTVKTLLMAGVTVLSLGAGAAMAQEAPSGAFSDYWTQRNAASATAPVAAPAAGQVRGHIHSFWTQARPVQNDSTFTGGLMGGGG